MRHGMSEVAVKMVKCVVRWEWDEHREQPVIGAALVAVHSRCLLQDSPRHSTLTWQIELCMRDMLAKTDSSGHIHSHRQMTRALCS